MLIVGVSGEYKLGTTVSSVVLDLNGLINELGLSDISFSLFIDKTKRIRLFGFVIKENTEPIEVLLEHTEKHFKGIDSFIRKDIFINDDPNYSEDLGPDEYVFDSYGVNILYN